MDGDDSTGEDRPGWVVDVSGPAAVRAGDVTVVLRPRERAVVAALAFVHPAEANASELAALIWPPPLPATATKSLHNHVARIRRSAPDLIVTGELGYRLGAGTSIIGLDGAGRAFEGLADSERLDARRRELGDIAGATLEAEVEQELRDAGAPAALPLARRLVIAQPYHDRAWWLLAAALAESGRRRDALTTLRDARAAFAEVGLALSDDLLDLERHLLAGRTIHLSPAPSRRDDGGQVRSSSTTTAVVVETAALRETSDLLAETPRVLALIGAAGSGKSVALRTGLARRPPGGTIHWSACLASPVEPIEPIAGLIREARPRLGPCSDPRLDDICRALVEPNDPRATRVGPDEVLEAALALFEPADADTWLVVEDVHWASPLSHRVIDHLAAAVRDGRLRCGLVVTARDGGWHPIEGDQVVRMRPWSESETALLLHGHGHPPTDQRRLAPVICDLSAGNALTIRELVTSLAGAGRGASTDRMPTSLRVALIGQVAELSIDARRLLDVLTVIGGPTDLATIATTLGPRSTTDAATELRQSSLVVVSEGGGLAIHHDAIRETLLDEMSPVQVAEFAHLLLADGCPWRPYEHANLATLAVDFDRDRAVRAHEHAGDLAAAAHAYSEAANHYDRAAQLTADEQERCRLVVAAGSALLAAAEDTGLERLRGAAHDAATVGLLDTLGAALVAMAQLGPASAFGATDPEIERWAELVVAGTADPALRARVRSVQTRMSSMSTDARRSRATFFLAEVDAEASGDPKVLGEVLAGSFGALSGPDDLEVRADRGRRLAALADDLDDDLFRWEAAQMALSVAVQRGEGELDVVVDRLGELTDRIRQPQRRWVYQATLVGMKLLRGEVQEAEQLLDGLFDFAANVDPQLVTAVYSAHLLALRLTQGRIAELDPIVAQLQADQPEVGVWDAVRSHSAALAGDPETSRGAFDRATDDRCARIEPDQSFLPALMLLGESAVALDDHGRVEAARDLLVPYAGIWTWHGTGTAGPIDLTRARLAKTLGDTTGARHAAAESAQAAARVGAPLIELAATQLLDSLGGP